MPHLERRNNASTPAAQQNETHRNRQLPGLMGRVLSRSKRQESVWLEFEVWSLTMHGHYAVLARALEGSAIILCQVYER